MVQNECYIIYTHHYTPAAPIEYLQHGDTCNVHVTVLYFSDISLSYIIEQDLQSVLKIWFVIISLEYLQFSIQEL